MKYKLKDLREDRDLTQAALAKVLNMTRTNYSRIENELTILTFDNAVIIAKFYNVALHDLINGEYYAPNINPKDLQRLEQAQELIAEVVKNIEKAKTDR